MIHVIQKMTDNLTCKSTWKGNNVATSILKVDPGKVVRVHKEKYMKRTPRKRRRRKRRRDASLYVLSWILHVYTTLYPAGRRGVRRILNSCRKYSRGCCLPYLPPLPLCSPLPIPSPSIHTCYLPASPHSVSQSFLAPAKSITFVPSLLNTGRPSVSCMARVSVASQDETGDGSGTGTHAARGTFVVGLSWSDPVCLVGVWRLIGTRTRLKELPRYLALQSVKTQPRRLTISNYASPGSI